jgi:acyl-CoA thioester hydrolase
LSGLKGETWRLDPGRYRVRQVLEPRYGDMDANAHLNNVAIARLFEETRVRTLSSLRDRPARGDPSSMMIAHVGIDYLAEGSYPEPIEACLAVSAIGRTSFRLALALFQKGAPFALADCAMVNLGPDRRPAAIDDQLRQNLERLTHG